MDIQGKEIQKRSDYPHIQDLAKTIEMSLEAFGMTVRVVEVNVTHIYYEFFLEIALGVELRKLDRLDRDLALALASPNGKVYWQIPVPGKSYVGLRLPRTTKNLGHHEIMHLLVKGWKSKLAKIFYSIGEKNFSIARRILGID
jgi:hypothetical protein